MYPCQFCGALLWHNGRIERCKGISDIQFAICCSKGKIKVPYFKPPPPFLKNLFFNKRESHSKHFLDNIRGFNNMFAFTSMGGKFNTSINTKGRAPYTFVLSGQNYHYLRSLLPSEGSKPIYSQLYIHDTDNEIQNRIKASRY